MANISGKPRLGWVHPRDAQGMGAEEATLQAGAGNVTAEIPGPQSFDNPKPSVPTYAAPRDSGGMADGETGGNYDQPEALNLQVAPGEGE